VQWSGKTLCPHFGLVVLSLAFCQNFSFQYSLRQNLCVKLRRFKEEVRWGPMYLLFSPSSLSC
jgi:hypothetical protein